MYLRFNFYTEPSLLDLGFPSSSKERGTELEEGLCTGHLEDVIIYFNVALVLKGIREDLSEIVNALLGSVEGREGGGPKMGF